MTRNNYLLTIGLSGSVLRTQSTESYSSTWWIFVAMFALIIPAVVLTCSLHQSFDDSLKWTVYGVDTTLTSWIIYFSWSRWFPSWSMSLTSAMSLTPFKNNHAIVVRMARCSATYENRSQHHQLHRHLFLCFCWVNILDCMPLFNPIFCPFALLIPVKSFLMLSIHLRFSLRILLLFSLYLGSTYCNHLVTERTLTGWTSFD